MTAVRGSVASIEEIWSYPVVSYAPVVLRIARHVKSKSAEVIGEPSSHFADSLIRNLTVKGFSASPPLASVGASMRSGDGTKFPWGSSCIARGRTCSSTVKWVQFDAAQDVIGLRQSGH